MEKQITLEQAGTACGKINLMIKKATSMLNAPLRLLGRYYSYVIERDGHAPDKGHNRSPNGILCHHTSG